MATTLGLDADGKEDVGVPVLRLQIAVDENDLRLRRNAREVEALAPDQDQIRRSV